MGSLATAGLLYTLESPVMWFVYILLSYDWLFQDHSEPFEKNNEMVYA